MENYFPFLIVVKSNFHKGRSKFESDIIFNAVRFIDEKPLREILIVNSKLTMCQFYLELQSRRLL